MEKADHGVSIAAKRLRRYFQAHPIAVITDQPIKQTTHSSERTVLADFLIEKPETDAVLPQSEVKLQDPWILFTDGSLCKWKGRRRHILTNGEGIGIHLCTAALNSSATNNEAEYTEASHCGIRFAARMGVRKT
ncbi:hypothetical protein Tco_1427330 [Tanacetum coccineum]